MEGEIIMRWIKRIFAGVAVIFLILFLIVKITTEYSTVIELENLFLENEEEFRRAAEVLTDVFLKTGGSINIDTENIYADANDDRIIVEQINELYFISFNDEVYSQEEYRKMYDAVEMLFLSLKIDAIAGSEQQIIFCVELAYGVESDIYFRTDGAQPAVLQTVKEQAEICDGWYAIISHD